MNKDEIPTGTRAVMFTFTCENGTPRVTFDLINREYARKTLAELQMTAIAAVLRAGKGEIINHKVHFIA